MTNLKTRRMLWIPGFFFVVVSLFLGLAYWRVGHVGLLYACATTFLLGISIWMAAFIRKQE